MVLEISGSDPVRADRDEKSLHAALLVSDLCEMSLGLVQSSADQLFAENNQCIWHGQTAQPATSAWAKDANVSWRPRCTYTKSGWLRASAVICYLGASCTFSIMDVHLIGSQTSRWCFDAPTNQKGQKLEGFESLVSC